MTYYVSSQSIDIPSVLNHLPKNANIMDVGCLGWRLVNDCLTRQMNPFGADIGKPANIPEHVGYYSMHLNGTIEAPNEFFDLVCASHVLEHMQDSYKFVHELMRITKPGGYVWIEAPSELSIHLQEHSHVEEHDFQSFYTDPTHLRPLPPGALYRLAIANYLLPVRIARTEQLFGTTMFPCSFMLARKPLTVEPTIYEGSRYVSFRDTKPSLLNAWKAIWNQELPVYPDNI